VRHAVGLLILDNDGVLVDSEPIAVRLDAQILSELGWSMTPDEVVERFTGRSEAVLLDAAEAYLGRPLPAGWAEARRQRFRTAFEAELRPVAGIVEALDAIAGLGIATCVASSGSHEKIEHSLCLCGLLARFAGRIFSGTEVAHAKPAPDLFLHAAAEMGVEPAGCVVVEDSEAGVEAARAAGMRVLAYAGSVTSAERLAGATEVFDDMRRLPDLLARLATGDPDEPA